MTESTWLAAAREVVETKSYTEVDGVLLDLFSASTMVQIHDALAPANAAKFAAMPIERAVEVAFKLAERAGAR